LELKDDQVDLEPKDDQVDLVPKAVEMVSLDDLELKDDQVDLVLKAVEMVSLAFPVCLAAMGFPHRRDAVHRQLGPSVQQKLQRTTPLPMLEPRG